MRRKKLDITKTVKISKHIKSDTYMTTTIKRVEYIDLHFLIPKGAETIIIKNEGNKHGNQKGNIKIRIRRTKKYGK